MACEREEENEEQIEREEETLHPEGGGACIRYLS